MKPADNPSPTVALCISVSSFDSLLKNSTQEYSNDMVWPLILFSKLSG